MATLSSEGQYGSYSSDLETQRVRTRLVAWIWREGSVPVGVLQLKLEVEHLGLSEVSGGRKLAPGEGRQALGAEMRREDCMNHVRGSLGWSGH
jgi:hypothetical protein